MCLPEHYIFGMKYVNGDTLADLRPDHSEIGNFHYDAVHGQVEGWAFRARLTRGAHPAENLERMNEGEATPAKRRMPHLCKTKTA